MSSRTPSTGPLPAAALTGRARDFFKDGGLEERQEQELKQYVLDWTATSRADDGDDDVQQTWFARVYQQPPDQEGATRSLLADAGEVLMAMQRPTRAAERLLSTRLTGQNLGLVVALSAVAEGLLAVREHKHDPKTVRELRRERWPRLAEALELTDGPSAVEQWQDENPSLRELIAEWAAA